MFLQASSFSSGVVCHRLSHLRSRRSFISDCRLLRRKTKASSGPPPRTTFVCVTFGIDEIVHNKRLYPRQLGSCQSLSTSAILYGNNNNFDFKTVFRSGGFPSTHSSAAVATAMSLGFERGLSDAVFGLAVVYASLIMYDAQGVRREVGIHAKALNMVLLQNSASSNDADDLIDSQPRKSSSNSESFGPLFLEEADTFQAKQTNAKLLLRSENRKSQSGILISSSLASDVEGESKKIANSWAMLKESVGHNEIEVIAGALLGLFVSFAVYTLT
ncbi:putative membrane protein YuiD [Camellia lanceoleosa]|uniref:Membrane protein YuiD n=1 Tax=Camellia lanceoleosa TaxID=1840588 RepID=A0ACC0H5E9_9ERIC|nr:putative membrane protein YuiD [Camellia lanceoleosa]